MILNKKCGFICDRRKLSSVLILSFSISSRRRSILYRSAIILATQLTDINIQKLQFAYEKMIEDDELMKELEDIIQYSARKIKSTIKVGAEIYEFVEDKLNIEPVGLIPLDVNEGYLFIKDGTYSNTVVYQYRMTIFEKHDEKYRGIRTDYVESWQRTVSNSPQNIKSELIRNKKNLPNPAVYHIETDLAYPLEETLLPIAKRSFVKYIAGT